MTTRTDIHRPSSDLFDPEAYDFFGVFDNHPEEGDARQRVQAVRALVNRGFKFGAGGSHNCGHCGARIRYAALMVREDVKQFIFVGETCLDNRFELTKAAFQELRATASLNRDRMRKAEKLAILLEQAPFLQELIDIRVEAMKGETEVDYRDDFILELAAKLVNYAELSEKQIAAAEKSLEWRRNRIAATAKREAEKAAQIASGAIKPAVSGRTQVAGEIVSDPKPVTGDYGTTWKIWVQTADGWKFYCSVPSALEEEIDKSIVKGAQVSMTITLKVADDDNYKAWGSRPAKFVVA
jgi:hypothetical protein